MIYSVTTNKLAIQNQSLKVWLGYGWTPWNLSDFLDFCRFFSDISPKFWCLELFKEHTNQIWRLKDELTWECVDLNFINFLQKIELCDLTEHLGWTVKVCQVKDCLDRLTMVLVKSLLQFIYWINSNPL